MSQNHIFMMIRLIEGKAYTVEENEVPQLNVLFIQRTGRLQGALSGTFALLPQPPFIKRMGGAHRVSLVEGGAKDGKAPRRRSAHGLHHRGTLATSAAVKESYASDSKCRVASRNPAWEGRD